MSYFVHTVEDHDGSSAEQHLTRLYALRPHKIQSEFSRSRSRFNIVPAGRRSGKTEVAKRKLIRTSVAPYKLGGSRFPDPKYFCAAPTRDQAKRIFWNDIKVMSRELGLWRREPSESQLICYLWPNVEIHIIGLDKPERIEGHPWDGGILDEYANMKKEAWPENIRPALSDRQGWCDLIGVPEGRNHYYDEWLKAKADDTGYRAPYHWFSSDILLPQEIEEAKKDLDELTFRQEYEGSFVNFTGMIYYQWREELHYSKCRQNYNKKDPIIFTFDFNVSPGTSAVLQEQTTWPHGLDAPRGDTITSCIGEVWIPAGSNTELVCKRLIADWSDHEGHVFCYGDATGGAQGTAKVRGSDWDLVKRHLYPVFGDRLHFKVKKKNPRERQRVNSVNSRLCNVNGVTHFQVDAKHCPQTIRDFEGTRVLEGSAGEIDKKTDPARTHLTDGIGYYIHVEYPIIRMIQPQEKHWK